jgi:hypothetical protein
LSDIGVFYVIHISPPYKAHETIQSYNQ